MDNLSAFVETLQDLMMTQNISPDELHKATRINLAVIYDWLKKAAVPALNSLVILSHYFECSVDYLIGRTEHNSFRKSTNPVSFAERFKHLFEESRVSYRKLSAETKIAVSCIQRFLNGTGKPLLDSLVRLADFFGCSVDYLIGLRDTP